jgi:hypothetical protein
MWGLLGASVVAPLLLEDLLIAIVILLGLIAGILLALAWEYL